MKAFMKAFKLIQLGFLLGTIFWMWIESEEKKEEELVTA